MVITQMQVPIAADTDEVWIPLLTYYRVSPRVQKYGLEDFRTGDAILLHITSLQAVDLKKINV